MTRRPVAALLLPALIGCTTFGPVNPREFIAAKRPLDVWVFQTDSSVVRLFRPKLLGDSLAGFVDDRYRIIQPGEIRTVQARQPAPGRTALLVVGAAAAVTLVALLVSGTGAEPPVADTGGAQIVHRQEITWRGHDAYIR